MAVVRALLFDLDGTLLNTLESLARCYNRVLVALGYPPHPTEAYRFIIGDGAEVAMRRALPKGVPEETVQTGLVKQRADYSKTWQDAVQVYEGIAELLQTLSTLGIPLAVLSNKDDGFTRQCVTHFFGDNLFAATQGFAADVPHKPDPSGAIKLAEQLACPVSSLALVGDTATDMKTARAAGMLGLGALWGFRDRGELLSAGADQLVSHPLQVIKAAGLESKT